MPMYSASGVARYSEVGPLDGAVGDGAVDPVGPRVTVGEHHDREAEFVAHPL